MGEAKRKRDRLRGEHNEVSLAVPPSSALPPATLPAKHLVIMQLSDIHIASPADLVLKRAEAIARTTNGLAHAVDLWVILVSGDIAMAGKAAEYALAERFLRELRSTLSDFHPQARIEFVLVPGNHDCDFAFDNGARRIFVQQIPSNPGAADASIIKTCLEVQHPYFDFMSTLENSATAPALSYQRKFTVDGVTVQFNCYNTAWLSQIKEKQGDLAFPPPSEDEASLTQDDAVLSVSVFHHPPAWLRSDNRRAFQGYVERTSDLIFTGHEHVAGTFHKANSTGEAIEYYEGGALQVGGGLSTSELVLVDIDLSGQTHRRMTFEWSRGQYERKTSSSSKPFVFGIHRHAELEFTSEFEDILCDPGAQFTHPARDKLLLEDIFVYPDLSELKVPPPARRLATIRTSSDLSQRIGPTELANVIFYGTDSAGKTTLAKKLCRDLTRRNFAAILMSTSVLSALKPDGIEEAIRKQELIQYGAVRAPRIAQLERARRIVFLDSPPWEREDFRRALDALRPSFGAIVIMGGDLMKLRDIPQAASDKNPFIGFARFEILPFGHVRRAKLISRWFDLSRQSGAPEDVIERKSRHATEQIGLATNTDFVPAFPIFLLILLQTIEAASPVDSPAARSRSYGYMHETIIIRALSKEPVTDVDTCLTYLAELGFFMFSSNVSRLSKTELQTRHDQYCAEYKFHLPFERMVEFLTKSSVLMRDWDMNNYEFRYPSVFQYSVARALASSPSRFEEHVPLLVDALHRDRSASILMFLVHLVRDDRVVDKMLEKARSLYANLEKCDLDKDVARFSEMAFDRDDLVLPSSSPEENRDALMVARDHAGTEPRPAEESRRGDQDNDDLNDLVRVNAALKTLEVLGQVVKSFPGSTLGARKREIVAECYSLGLRAMNAFVSLVRDNAELLVTDVEKFLKEKGLSSEEIGGKAARFVYWVGEAWVVLFLVKTAQGVGLDSLWQTYDEIVQGDRSLGVKFVDIAVRLENFAEFPTNQMDALLASTEEVSFTRGILARLVYRHMYLYRTSHQVQDKLANKLKIRATDVPTLQLKSQFQRN